MTTRPIPLLIGLTNDGAAAVRGGGTTTHPANPNP
jgi:hypothetical protein